jgi:hypothetical protein
MARDILGEYGPESRQPQAPRATSGGVMMAKPRPYSPPMGPTNINDPKGPGLHGHNCGPCGTQGPYPTRTDGNRGSPGLHGHDNYGHGVNRRG